MKLDPRLLRLVRDYQAVFLLTVTLGLAGGMLVIWQARLLSQVVAGVFLYGLNLSDVSRLMIVLLVVLVLRAVAIWGMDGSAGEMAAHVKCDLREELFTHISALGPAYLSRERTGELTSVAVEGIEALDAYFSQYLPQVILAGLIPLLILLFIFPLDALSAVLLLLTAPLIPVFMVLIGGASHTVTQRQWQSLQRMSAYFLDVVQGLTTLKILGRSLAQIKVITQISERYRQTTMGVLRVTFLSALALEMVATISTAVVAVEIGLRLLYGRLAFSEAFFVLLLAPEFYLPLRMLGTRFHAGMSGIAAAERIFAILEIPIEKPAGQSAPTPTPVLNGKQVIHFEDVFYSYRDGQAALKGVSFVLQSGQTLALVGPSGAGKSTVANLLLGFLHPDQGDVKIAGKRLADISPESWRSQVAWVPQRPYLFNDTVAANIRLARPDASLAAVQHAARLAHAEEFIQDLPHGYQSVIGERGSRLSAGQAQRIALARAFLKDAPLIVMDEPTANLDPENEALIREASGRLLHGQTALIIAHRLNTVYRADHILVMRDGQVVESGAHHELLVQGELYPNLVRAYSGGGETPSITTGSPVPMQIESRPVSQPALVDQNQAMLYTPPQPRGWSYLLRLVRLIALHKARIALSVLLGFATVASGIGLMTTSAYIISAAALQPSIAALQVAIVGVRFFGISRGIFRYLERLVTHDVTFRILAELRVWLYGALEPLAPARLSRYRSGDLLARVTRDINMLENLYVRALAPPLVALSAGIAVVYFLYTYHPGLALNALIFLCLAGLGVPGLVRWLSHKPGGQLLSIQARLSSETVDGIQGLADLLVYGQQRNYHRQVVRTANTLSDIHIRFARINALQSSLITLFAGLAVWGALYLAIPLVEAGQIGRVFLAGLLLATLTSFEAVMALPLAAHFMETNIEAARRLFEIADTPAEIVDPAEPLPAPAFSRLEVKELRFRYPVLGPRSISGISTNSQSPVLDGLSFELMQGGRLAIVGPSGAGKSTLVNLLLRFWEIRSGEILLDGDDLCKYNSYDVRDGLAVIDQNTYLFNATIRENLLLAQPEADERDLVWATKLAQIHAFIQSLPEGFDTRVGEGGKRLSAGERQRLAIARALLRKSPILVLDEATVYLDALIEREVLDVIFNSADRRMLLFITHRLVGMESMDLILVLKQGQIVERGKHRDLLTRGGYYRRMWDLQNELLLDASCES